VPFSSHGCAGGGRRGLRTQAEASVEVASSPVIDGWKRRSVSDNGTPSRELCWCAAATCRFSPPGDLHIFWHLSQGKPPETGDMMREGDKRSAGTTGTPQAWIRRPPTCSPTCSTITVNYVFPRIPPHPCFLFTFSLLWSTLDRNWKPWSAIRAHPRSHFGHAASFGLPPPWEI
jgi:hypothetical protein